MMEHVPWAAFTGAAAAVFVGGALAALWHFLIRRSRRTAEPEQAKASGAPAKKEAPAYPYQHGPLRGRLVDIATWEVVAGNGLTYRAHSHLDPRDNEWLTRDGRAPSRAAAASFAVAVELWRKQMSSEALWRA